MGMLTDVIKSNALKAWTLVKFAILHADAELIRRLIDQHLPIYLTHPTEDARYMR